MITNRERPWENGSELREVSLKSQFPASKGFPAGGRELSPPQLTLIAPRSKVIIDRRLYYRNCAPKSRLTCLRINNLRVHATRRAIEFFFIDQADR